MSPGPDRYAVLGHPIAHSLSPEIHHAFARATGESISYQTIDVSPEQFDDFWRHGEGRELRGANITLPLKVLARDLADRLSPAARETGSVNTLIPIRNGWYGDTTDGIGLIRDLDRLGWSLAARRILIIGAGGAGRGIAFPVARSGPRELVIANRTADRAQQLADDLGRTGLTARGCGLDELQNLEPVDGLLHASAAGHGGQLQLPVSLLQVRTWCYDLSYGEAAQPFMRWAREAGATRVSDGLGMLVEQAAESFFLWRGVRPETAPVLAMLLAMLRDGSG